MKDGKRRNREGEKRKHTAQENNKIQKVNLSERHRKSQTQNSHKKMHKNLS